jgi:hypothetical protein
MSIPQLWPHYLQADPRFLWKFHMHRGTLHHETL